jgi:cyclic pyranopterin phosphate synthase
MPDLSQPGGAAESPQTLVDPYGRRLHYLRLSVTDRCNFRCVYCMPAGGMDKLNQNEILSLEELARVAQTAVDLGVDKIRLTGGEPLVRRDLDVLLRRLDRLRPRPDLRITTNGFHLARFLPRLLDCGVSTVNVSMDTLDPERYGRIVGLGPERGREAFARVWKGIQAALRSPNIRVKINVVLLAAAALSGALPFDRRQVWDILDQGSPPARRAANEKLFELGAGL